MRYSYEFKRKCVDMYRKGIWPETPNGVSKEIFRKTVRKWVKIEDNCSPNALQHKTQNKAWSAEERYELVAQVLAEKSNKEVAFSNGISDGQLYQWVRKYKDLGYNGLANTKKGRPSKEQQVKQKVKPKPLTESERDELIRLRAENEYIKAKNEVIKKRSP